LVEFLNSKPAPDGFRMPGEFEPHKGCWIIWPERPDNWRFGAKPAQKAFAKVAEEISKFEPVTVGVSREQYKNARAVLSSKIRVVELSSNDSWVRDTGPTFVKKGNEIRAIDWKFNSYGGLEDGAYFPWDQDELIAGKISEIEGTDCYRAPLVLEGGSIHVDGEGTCLTTEQCLLNPNRNPQLNRGEIENFLKDYLNVEKIIWLQDGVYNDETDGHIDNLACFIKPGEVLLTWTDDKSNPQYEISKKAYERLKETVDARGRKIKIQKIHQPGPLYMTEEEIKGIDCSRTHLEREKGRRLPASYVNFYLANGAAIVPTFSDPNDKPALRLIKELFPEREVIGIPSREIILGGGNIHCITQQVPE